MAEPPHRPDQQEPSMEDILASIRSILNEDEGRDGPPPLDLTEEMLVPSPRSPAAIGAPSPARAPLPLRRLANTGPAAPSPPASPPPALPPPVAILPAPPEAARQPEPPAMAAPKPGSVPASLVPPEPAPNPAPPRPVADDALVGPVAAAAAAAALGQLARAVSEDRHAPVARQGGASIEDVVREELRPLLKSWLEQHLPPLVERLVKAEITRVMSGGKAG